MGFSPGGLALALAVLAPSLLLLALPPRDGLPSARVPRALTMLERAGQAGCLLAAASTARFGGIDAWLALALAALVGYYGLWVRYVVGGRKGALLYAPVGPIPVPMAILPALVFGLAAVSGRSWWLAGSSAVLAVGHISSSLLVARAARSPAPGADA